MVVGLAGGMIKHEPGQEFKLIIGGYFAGVLLGSASLFKLAKQTSRAESIKEEAAEITAELGNVSLTTGAQK